MEYLPPLMRLTVRIRMSSVFGTAVDCTPLMLCPVFAGEMLVPAELPVHDSWLTMLEYLLRIHLEMLQPDY
jgi:hypothetical protein